MSCERFERRLQQLLDAGDVPRQDRLLVAHARACSHCRGLLHAQAILFQGLRASRPTAGPGADFSRDIVASLQQTVTAPTRYQVNGRRLLALAVAAAVLVVTLPQFWKKAGELKPQGSLTPPASSQPVTAAVPSKASAVDAPWPQLALPIRYPSGFAEGKGTQDLQQYVQRWYENLSGDKSLEPVQELTGSIRPLASTVNAAVGAIWETIPKSTTPSAPSLERSSA